MEGSIFAEIRTDYADMKGVIHLDGYKTDDDNEQGTGIGYFINGEIYWRDPEFQFDPYVAEILAELQEDYKKEREEKQKEIRQAIQDVYYRDGKPRPQWVTCTNKTAEELKAKMDSISEGAENIMRLLNL